MNLDCCKRLQTGLPYPLSLPFNPLFILHQDNSFLKRYIFTQVMSLFKSSQIRTKILNITYQALYSLIPAYFFRVCLYYTACFSLATLVFCQFSLITIIGPLQMLLSLPGTVIFPPFSSVYFLLILPTQSLLHWSRFFIVFNTVVILYFI